LDGAWSNLVWWKVSLPMAGGLELDDLSGPFQPKPFCDSMISTSSANRLAAQRLLLFVCRSFL